MSPAIGRSGPDAQLFVGNLDELVGAGAVGVMPTERTPCAETDAAKPGDAEMTVAGHMSGPWPTRLV